MPLHDPALSGSALQHVDAGAKLVTLSKRHRWGNPY